MNFINTSKASNNFSGGFNFNKNDILTNYNIKRNFSNY
jgi:hypothetical protein